MEEIICVKCKIPLVKGKAFFKYLGHNFQAEVMECPSCGRVFLSEEMVNNKIRKVETSLEDK